MKTPTKATKLRWIRRVQRRYANTGGSGGYSCGKFRDLGWNAYEWYRALLLSFTPDAEPFFYDFPNDNDRRQARLTWLAFLFHWVKTGEIK